MNQQNIFKRNPKLFLETAAVVVSLLLMITASFFGTNQIAPWLWGAAFIIGGFSKAVEGVTKTIQEKSLNVEFLMIAAALAAFTTGDYAEGAVLIFIFAVSGVLEAFAMAQSEKALTSLLKLAPKQAILLTKDGEKVIAIQDLVINDLVIVKPGQQIPADGVITLGGATIDQASITGEFSPVQKLVGDSVYAGAIVLDSAIRVKVLKDPKQSVVQKMIDFVAKAQSEKTQSETKVALFEKIYVYVVIALALAVMFITPVLGWLTEAEAFSRGVIILVVASPCALVASITPAILSTLSHSARRGILIKSGRHLENLLKIKVIAFDKTGTITTGKPIVKDFFVDTGYDQQTVLYLLVNAERQSNHPLAKAIVDHYHTIPVVKMTINETPGRGLTIEQDGRLWQIGRFDHQISDAFGIIHQQAISRGETLVQIICDQKLIAFVSLTDTIRPDAIQAIQEIKDLGLTPLMLTGDRHETAASIATQVGITSYRGDCLPEDKVQHIQSFKEKHQPILMIGDGINDAPSLAVADLGIAMGDGTDVSLETADIVMMNNNLANVPYLFRLTKRMKRIVRQNIVFSMSVIAVLLFANFFGLVVLRYGVLSHELSTILVILNSLRLLSFRRKKI